MNLQAISFQEYHVMLINNYSSDYKVRVPKLYCILVTEINYCVYWRVGNLEELKKRGDGNNKKRLSQGKITYPYLKSN